MAAGKKTQNRSIAEQETHLSEGCCCWCWQTEKVMGELGSTSPEGGLPLPLISLSGPTTKRRHSRIAKIDVTMKHLLEGYYEPKKQKRAGRLRLRPDEQDDAGLLSALWTSRDEYDQLSPP
jgi:hypothetical protein